MAWWHRLLYFYQLYYLSRCCFRGFILMFWSLVLSCHLIVHKRMMISNAWHPNSRNFEKWLQMSWVHRQWRVLMGHRRFGRVIKNLIWLCAVNFDVAWNDICEAISYIYQLMISISGHAFRKNQHKFNGKVTLVVMIKSVVP